MNIQLNVHAIIERAVDEGVEQGVRRAYKHTETPDIFDVCQAVVTAVMEMLDEVIIYPPVVN